MRAREFKDAVFDQVARISSAFASPKRLELIDLLIQGERHVEALADLAGLSVANTSRHLQVLKAAHLVRTRKNGLRVYYRIADEDVGRGYRALLNLSEAHLAEMERLVGDYFADTDGLEPLQRDELLRRARSGEVVVIDVRPMEEYAAGHIEGALSIPLKDLDRRLADLPAGKHVVAYCRGPYCVLAAEAVRRLRGRGLEAARLEDGYPEWREAGLPVSVGAERFPPAPRSET